MVPFTNSTTGVPTARSCHFREFVSFRQRPISPPSPKATSRSMILATHTLFVILLCNASSLLHQFSDDCELSSLNSFMRSRLEPATSRLSGSADCAKANFFSLFSSRRARTTEGYSQPDSDESAGEDILRPQVAISLAHICTQKGENGVMCMF